MPHESRLKKSLLNARVNLIFYFLSLALSFFSRNIHVLYFGWLELPLLWYIKLADFQINL